MTDKKDAPKKPAVAPKVEEKQLPHLDDLPDDYDFWGAPEHTDVNIGIPIEEEGVNPLDNPLDNPSGE